MQYIENTAVNIGIIDPRNKEVVFRILGRTKRLPLERAYDGIQLDVGGISLGKYNGPHIIKTELGITEELKGGSNGYVDLTPELRRSDVTLKEVEKVYKEMFKDVLNGIVIFKVQPMLPDGFKEYQMT